MDVRDQLVQAGVELLETNGVAALTQRQIATKVGVSHGAPRHHFPTYASLLAAIARVGVEELDTIIRKNVALPDARSAVLSVGTNVVQYAIDHPAMFELIARHDLLENKGGSLREITGGWLDLLTARVRDIRPDANHHHGLALWAGVQGLGTMLSRKSADVVAQGVDPTAVLALLIDGVTRAY